MEKYPNNKFSPRHFIMIPFEDENFIKDYKELCDLLEKEKPKGYDFELLQKPGKLHTSVIVLDLKDDPNEVSKIENILDKIHPKMKELADSGITFNFDDYDVFDSTERTRVVFAKMKEDESYRKIELIIDLIIKTLIKENVISRNDIESYHISFENNLYKIVLHLTLLNTMFLNKILKKKNKKPIKSFNSQDILAVMYKKNLTSCPLNKINFCVMREDKSIGKYELVKSYDLY
jgi:hypothetical protein